MSRQKINRTFSRSNFGEKEERTLNYFRKTFDIDVVVEFERLKDVAAVPANQLRNKGALVEAINFAAKNAIAANMIWQKAKKLREAFRVEYNQGMRSISRLALVRVENFLNEIGSKRKQITKEMISEEICAMADTREPYEELHVRQQELREIVSNTEALAKRWAERESTLQTQARLLTSQRDVKLVGMRGGDSYERNRDEG